MGCIEFARCKLHAARMDEPGGRDPICTMPAANLDLDLDALCVSVSMYSIA